MSHMLEKLSDGSYSMAYAGETPWHGLGVKVPAELTPTQMLKKAKLDWTVDKVPAYITYKGKKIYTGKEALVRSSDSRVLTNTSEDWEPVQNIEAAEFFNDFVLEGQMAMETMGSLRDGNVIWALAKVKDSFTLFGGDKVESHLLFSNPHEYGKCIDIRFTPIRVVCWNTLTLSLGRRGDLMVRLNHRHKFDADDVKKTLGIASSKLSAYKDMAKFLGSKRYTDKTLVEYLGQVFPTNSVKKNEDKQLSRPAKIAYDIVGTQPGADFAPGTYWSAFNASTFTIDHLLGHNQNNRLYSSWYGVNRKKKVEALEIACEMAKAA